MDNIEIWKDVKGFEGLYQVSNYGNIKSLPKKKGKGKGYFTKEKILKPKTDRYGYFVVCLRKNNKNHNMSIHRCVALSFCKNPFNKTVVNHKDGNKKNNMSSNLEWCTVQENTKHAYDNNLGGFRDNVMKNLAKIHKRKAVVYCGKH